MDTLGDKGGRGNEDAMLQNRWDRSLSPATKHNNTIKQPWNNKKTSKGPRQKSTDQDRDMNIDNHLKPEPPITIWNPPTTTPPHHTHTRTDQRSKQLKKQQSDAKQETNRAGKWRWQPLAGWCNVGRRKRCETQNIWNPRHRQPGCRKNPGTNQKNKTLQPMDPWQLCNASQRKGTRKRKKRQEKQTSKNDPKTQTKKYYAYEMKTKNWKRSLTQWPHPEKATMTTWKKIEN